MSELIRDWIEDLLIHVNSSLNDLEPQCKSASTHRSKTKFTNYKGNMNLRPISSNQNTIDEFIRNFGHYGEDEGKIEVHKNQRKFKGDPDIHIHLESLGSERCNHKVIEGRLVQLDQGKPILEAIKGKRRQLSQIKVYFQKSANLMS